MNARIAVILAGFPALLGAQGIRGTAADQGGQPLAGVVVFLLDQRDSVVSRALSNELGEFRVVAGGAGSYRLRTMRIGFRPTVSASFALAAGQEIVQNVTLTGLPFSLDTVRVVERNSCRFTGDSSSTTFAIWEQVRAALTATQLTTGSRGVEATLMTYERSLDPDRERVLSQNARIVSGRTRAPWTSPSADSLRRVGYVVTNLDGSTTYWAPALNVLLSDQFIEDHCFELASSRDPTRIGLSFAPTRERRGKAGIRGTLWLDRRSSELRRMEFRYTNATREQEYGSSGGNIEFARVKNGAWVISGWNIRMPVLVRRQERLSGFGTATVPELRVEAIRVEGGEVSLVIRSPDTLWKRPPLPLVGVVTDSATGTQVAGAQVLLRGTAMAATTDAAGRFRIADALPGIYTAEVRAKSLTPFGYVHTIPLMFTDTTTVHALQLPSVSAIVRRLCPLWEVGAAGVSRDGLVAGVVRLAFDTAAPAGARVFAQWNDVTPTGARFGGIEAIADARGHFSICRLPRGTKLTITASLDSAVGSGPAAALGSGRALYVIRGARSTASSPPVEVTLLSERFASVELVLDTTLTRGATFAGVVLSDINGQPIPDVEVAIAELSKNVFTNEQGAFRLDDIAPGRRVVAVRRVGYAPRLDTIAFAPSRTVERSLLLSRVSALDTVAVTEPMLRDFEERRRLGLGQFLTRADIEKLHGRPIGSTLSQLRGAGISADQRSNKAWILTSRPRTSQSDYWCPDSTDRWEAGEGVRCACYAQVYLDRSLMNPAIIQRKQVGPVVTITRPTPPFDVNSIPSAMIEAIEWYSGPAETPPEFSTLGHGCGVLVIHTRRTR